MIPGFHGVDLIIVLVPLLIWLWSIIDCINLNRRLSALQRVLWLLVIIFVPVFGSLVYLIAARLFGNIIFSQREPVRHPSPGAQVKDADYEEYAQQTQHTPRRTNSY